MPMGDTLISYPGSSGYDVSGYPMIANPQQYSKRPDYGVYDVASGKMISVLTRKPWTGTEPRTGGTYRNGDFVSAASTTGGIDPNNPAQRYKPVDIVKSPDIAQGQQELMKTFKDTAASSMKGFNDYLSSFQRDLAGARSKLAGATDIAPTIGALTTAQHDYSSALGGANRAYQEALAGSAAGQRGVVQQAQDLLPMYDTAQQNVANAQFANLAKWMERYKLGTGTPTSMGSDEARILARAAGEIALPLEQAKIGQRYNILSGLALPVEQNLAGQNINYAGSFLPGIAGSQYSSATTLANTIQALKERVAGMSTQQAIAFLQAQGVPAQVMQQILGGQITEMGGLANLEDMSRYRGLQDVLGVNVSQPIGYNMALPGYPQYPIRYPNTRTATYPTPALGPNAPVQVSPLTYAAGQTGPYYQGVTNAGGVIPPDLFADQSGAPSPVTYAPAPSPTYSPGNLGDYNLNPELLSYA